MKEKSIAWLLFMGAIILTVVGLMCSLRIMIEFGTIEAGMVDITTAMEFISFLSNIAQTTTTLSGICSLSVIALLIKNME